MYLTVNKPFSWHMQSTLQHVYTGVTALLLLTALQNYCLVTLHSSNLELSMNERCKTMY